MRYHRIYRVVVNERMVRNNILISMTSSKMVKIQMQLPEDLRTRFKSKCVLDGATMNEVLVKLVKEWTEETPKQSDPVK